MSAPIETPPPLTAYVGGLRRCSVKTLSPEIAYNKVKRGYLKSSRFDELLEEGLAK